MDSLQLSISQRIRVKRWVFEESQGTDSECSVVTGGMFVAVGGRAKDWMRAKALTAKSMK
jgi:hypothetical protein